LDEISPSLGSFPDLIDIERPFSHSTSYNYTLATATEPVEAGVDGKRYGSTIVLPIHMRYNSPNSAGFVDIALPDPYVVATCQSGKRAELEPVFNLAAQVPVGVPEHTNFVLAGTIAVVITSLSFILKSV
jgi:hypothetical protein